MSYMTRYTIIVWVVSWIVFSFGLYFLGIKGDWQRMRIKKGLASENDKISPNFFTVNKITKYHERGNSLRLLFYSFIISFFVILSYYLITTDKEAKSLPSHIVSLFILCGVIAGIPLKVEDVFETNKDKMFVRTLNIVANIKTKIIEQCISNEYTSCEQFVLDRIRDIFKENSKIKQGALIIRINSDFFNMILPQDIDESKREGMRDYAYRLLILYMNDDITLIDELLRLFKKNIFELNVSMIEVLEFMNNQEIMETRITQDRINKYIDEQVNNKKSVKAIPVSVGDLKGMINNVLA